MVGETYRSYLVKAEDNRDSRGRQYYICTCLDCNAERSVRADSLRRGEAGSCRSCAHRKYGHSNPAWRGVGDVSATFFKSCKSSAKKRGIDFQITKEFLNDLLQEQSKKCALSGKPIEIGKRSLGDETTASVDRIDSSKGYEVGNIQWLHKDVNYMKRTLSQEDFISFCRDVIRTQEEKIGRVDTGGLFTNPSKVQVRGKESRCYNLRPTLRRSVSVKCKKSKTKQDCE